MFGGFIKNSGPDFIRLNRANWDNSQFMDYQGKDVFLLPFESYDVRFHKRIIPGEKELFARINEFSQKYPHLTGEQLDEYGKNVKNKMTKTVPQKCKMRVYLPVRAFFLGGEWNFVTQYHEGHLIRSMSMKPSHHCMSWEEYRGEELGIIKSEFGKLPYWMEEEIAKEKAETETKAACNDSYDFSYEEHLSMLTSLVLGEITVEEIIDYEEKALNRD
jgi:hypothetical protein